LFQAGENVKTLEEVEYEMNKLLNEADSISDFLIEDNLEDENLKEELQKRQIICRSKALALLWVMDEKSA
jgi:hypothetical protein